MKAKDNLSHELFDQVFGDTQITRGFLEQSLPKELLDQIDLNTVRFRERNRRR